MFFVFPSVYIYIITNILHDSLLDRIGGVMVGVLASSTVDCWSPGQVKSKTIKLVFVASPLSMQPKGERAKTGWLRIRIMCQSGATCLSADLFQ